MFFEHLPTIFLLYAYYVLERLRRRPCPVHPSGGITQDPYSTVLQGKIQQVPSSIQSARTFGIKVKAKKNASRQEPQERLEMVLEKYVMFTGGDVGRNSINKTSSQRSRIIFVKKKRKRKRNVDYLYSEQAGCGEFGVTGKALGCWALFFTYPHFQKRSFFPFILLPSPQNLSVQYPLLPPSSFTKSTIRERSDIGDLWFGRN